MKTSKSELSSFSGQLATFIDNTNISNIPANVLHEAKRSLLNYFGSALGGINYGPVQDVLSFVSSYSGPRLATVIGSDVKLDAFNAAFINSISANILDFDDTHIPTIIHPTSPVASAVLSLGEIRNASGVDILNSIVVGIETSCRCGMSVFPGQYNRGWHVTSTCGILGAAAGTSKLIKLSPSFIANAIGIAASQSSGLVENLPTSARNIQVGNAAKNGVFASLMAERHWDSALTTLEGVNGWAHAMGDILDPGKLLLNLGSHWELLSNTYKAYPCGVVIVPVIDACLNLQVKNMFNISDIERITVTGNPLLLSRADRPTVTDERVAKVSLHHACAVALYYKKAGINEFSQHTVMQPFIESLRNKVSTKSNDLMPVSTANVQIQLSDGRILDETVSSPLGGIDNPLSDKDIENKFTSLLDFSNLKLNSTSLIDAIWNIEKISNIQSLLNLTRSS
jgi:2-methylcitrate dehydratase PrpD